MLNYKTITLSGFPKKDSCPPYKSDARFVKQATDLPARLFMGYRKDVSFQKHKDGFIVRYQDLEGNEIEELSYNGKQVSLNQCLPNKKEWTIRMFMPGHEMSHLIQNMAQIPESLEDYYEHRVPELGNIHYFRHKENVHTYAGFPDGYMINFLMPTKITDIERFADFMRGLSEDRYKGFPSPICRMQITTMTINYLVSQKWDINNLDTACASIMSYELFEGGIPTQAPVIEKGKDESVAITFRKLMPIVIGDIFIRDIEPFFNTLIEAGFISKLNQDDIDYSHWDTTKQKNYNQGAVHLWASPPFSTKIVPIDTLLGEYMQCWSPSGKSRITYEGPFFSTEKCLEGHAWERANFDNAIKEAHDLHSQIAVDKKKLIDTIMKHAKNE